jgi:hypothetical protein
MQGTSPSRARLVFGLLGLALILGLSRTVLAQPAWYTRGVGGFDPNVPKFYQHQDVMGGDVEGANGWEPGGGWCGWVAYDDIFYAVTKQGYQGLYPGATDPTANPWYAATYGAAGTDLYNIRLVNNSGNTADSVSVVFTGTGGSVNNLGAPPPGFNGFTPTPGTVGTLNGPVGGANGFSLNYTPALPKYVAATGAGYTAAFFNAIPGIQFNSGQWNSAANGNVAVDPVRDAVSVSEGASVASVQSSDIANIVKNMANFDVQAYLNKYVNTNAANNGKASLWSGTWTVDGNGNVDYLGLQNGNTVIYKMFGISPVTFTRGVMGVCNGQEVIQINQGNRNGLTPAQVGNVQGLWWAAPTPAKAKPGNYHMLAVSGIDVAGNALYLADPDTNPNNPAGATGVAQANGGWPFNNVNFPGNAPFNLKTSPSASLPVPAAPVVGGGNATSWNQLYSDFSFTPNGAFDAINSTQSTQYNGCGLTNLQTIMKNPLRTINAAPAGPGKEETAIAVALPTDAASAVDQILVEPSQQTLDPVANASLDSFSDPSEAGSVWTDAEAVADPFGNSLADDGILYDLASGNGLEPGESATIDVGTAAEFANEGYDVLLHYEANADNPNGFWMPYMDMGSELDPSAAINGAQQGVPEPATSGLILVALLGMASRRRRDNHGILR